MPLSGSCLQANRICHQSKAGFSRWETELHFAECTWKRLASQLRTQSWIYIVDISSCRHWIRSRAPGVHRGRRLSRFEPTIFGRCFGAPCLVEKKIRWHMMTYDECALLEISRNDVSFVNCPYQMMHLYYCIARGWHRPFYHSESVHICLILFIVRPCPDASACPDDGPAG